MNVNVPFQSESGLREVNESNFPLAEELRRLRFGLRRAIRSVNDQARNDLSFRIDAMVSVNIVCAAPHGLWVES